MAASWSVMRTLYLTDNIMFYKGKFKQLWLIRLHNLSTKNFPLLPVRHAKLLANKRYITTTSSDFVKRPASSAKSCERLTLTRQVNYRSWRNGVVNQRTLYCRLPNLCSTTNQRTLHWRVPNLCSTTSASTDCTKQRNVSNGKVVVTYDVPTLPGEKKDTSCPLPPAYSPCYVEAAWYDWWMKMGFFSPEFELKGNNSKDSKPFVMCLPPPNVTGNLHLGHALTNSIQDAIVRWHRMKGEVTLWNPGCDHAGIATQVVVEKKLWRERQITKHDIGRERFIEEIWKWKDEKGEIITDQMKKMGSSLDWNRARFTMDEPMSRAVTEAFVRLHEDDLIYRSDRLVNWCCHLKSSISDIEVENLELEERTSLDVPGYENQIEFGVLHFFAYPVEGTGEEIVVATTRLEMMLGDTAVCVHPDDARFTHLHGKFLLHPTEERQLPVITDDFVDPSFGTGAVKITPGHDYMDYDIGVKHGLDVVSILDDEGKLINVTTEFQGMKRFDARSEVLRVLTEKGLYRGSKDHPMVIPLCSRSGDVIEPRLKEQWFVSCSEMAQEAAQAVRNGELKITPPMYESDWYNWLDNIRDWCISRQLWWGHRIPAYLAKRQTDEKGIWVSGQNQAEVRSKAALRLGIPENDVLVERDEDVLDTWFSSGLFPFAVFGWPDQPTDSPFYPTTLLETGHDILFFWVARMVMLGRRLTGQLPFKEILLHGILRDAHGRKMSKSLGNVIDPMDVIQGRSLESLKNQLRGGNLSQTEIRKAEQGLTKDFPEGIPECGTDALRFGLCSYNFKATEINMDVTHIKSYRHFCNKIWQAFKFVVMNLGDDFKPSKHFQVTKEGSFVDQWIISRLCHMVQSCDQYFTSHDLHLVTKSLYMFWYTEFCNVYLESVKPVLWDLESPHRGVVKETLWLCMNTALRATSPFMPFLTEELYQRFPKLETDTSESVCVAPYPSPTDYPWRNIQEEGDMETVLLITGKVLSTKKDFNLSKIKPDCFIQMSDKETQVKLNDYCPVISTLARCGTVHIINTEDQVPYGCVSTVVTNNCKLHVLLKVWLSNLSYNMGRFHKANFDLSPKFKTSLK